MKLSDYEHLIGKKATIHPHSRFFHQMTRGDNASLTVKRPHFVGKKLWFSCRFPNVYQNDYTLDDLLFLDSSATNKNMKFLLGASPEDVDTGGR